MNNMIETLMLRNLQEVFGEGDVDRRRIAISELYTDNCVVYLPAGRFAGQEALNLIAGEIRSGHPNYVYTPHSVPQVIENAGRLYFGSGPVGEPPHYTGMDIAIVIDGKINVLYVFLDSSDK